MDPWRGKRPTFVGGVQDSDGKGVRDQWWSVGLSKYSYVPLKRIRVGDREYVIPNPSQGSLERRLSEILRKIVGIPIPRKKN